jgi:hypothetical protein
MTVALSVLGLGLAVAALAGIPAFIENRIAGDVAALAGFAIAIVGSVLLLSAIPGQRRQNAELKAGRAAIARNAEIDADQLRIERRRLFARKSTILAKIGDAMANRDSWEMLGSRSRARDYAVEVKGLEAESADLEAQIEMNANELWRLGVEPDAN